MSNCEWRWYIAVWWWWATSSPVGSNLGCQQPQKDVRLRVYSLNPIHFHQCQSNCKLWGEVLLLMVVWVLQLQKSHRSVVSSIQISLNTSIYLAQFFFRRSFLWSFLHHTWVGQDKLTHVTTPPVRISRPILGIYPKCLLIGRSGVPDNWTAPLCWTLDPCSLIYPFGPH